MKQSLYHLKAAVMLTLAFIFHLTALAFDVDGITYTPSANNTCFVAFPASTWTPTSTLTIPDEVTYNGTTYKVTGIGSVGITTSTGVFAAKATIKKVEMGANVEFIGDRAFAFCSGLTTVDFSKCTNLKRISMQAFYACPIATLTLPDNICLANISPSAFVYSGNTTGSITTINVGMTDATDAGCLNPTAVFGDAVTTLNYTKSSSTVKGNWNTLPRLKTVTVASGSDVDEGTFRGCTTLTSVTLTTPNIIGPSAFEGCTALTSVTLTTPNIIGPSAFEGCTALTTASMSGVKEIGAAAFKGCTALTTASMSGVKEIGAAAFEGCTALTSAKLNTNAVRLGERCFAGSGLSSAFVTIKSGSEVGAYAFENTHIKAFDISGSPVAAGAFNGIAELTSISISGWTSTLSANTFFGVGPNVEISLPTYDIAPANTFNGCAANVSIGTLEYCKTSAFHGFTGNLSVGVQNKNHYYSDATSPLYGSDVKSVTFRSTTILPTYVFQNCPQLQRIVMNGTNEYVIPANFVIDCPSLEEFTATTGQASNNRSFQNCPKLRHVTLNGNKVVQTETFSECKALETINGNDTGAYTYNGSVYLYLNHNQAIVQNENIIEAGANAISTPELIDMRGCTANVVIKGTPAQLPMAKTILIKAGTESLFTALTKTGTKVIAEGVAESNVQFGDIDCDGSVSVADVTRLVKRILYPTESTTTATLASGQTEMPWIQLWENGPKFAKYNIGVDYYGAFYNIQGTEYAWGKTDPTDRDAYVSTTRLDDEHDTATQLWGDAWRMPTSEEWQALLDNCNLEWTDSDDETHTPGYYIKGKGPAWSANKIFIPSGWYWTSDVEGDIDHLFIRLFAFTATSEGVMTSQSVLLHDKSLVRPVLK